MKQLILALLFSKTILLTPGGLTLAAGQQTSIALREPISAISPGASVQIDVTKMLDVDVGEEIPDRRKWVEERFAPGSVAVKLLGAGQEVELEFQGATRINDTAVRLVLSADSMPTDVEFTEVRISSETPLERVDVYWQNSRH